MKRIAFKIDVDSLRGASQGVPQLIDLLSRHHAGATFYFALGPDNCGREARATSLAKYYGWRERLHGCLFSGPRIGTLAAREITAAHDAGFEIGVHGWDRVRWEKTVRDADNGWVESEMFLAAHRHAEIFSTPPRTHAAPGWLMNRHALRLTQRLGFHYASDCRGSHPFMPVIDGELVRCPQIPTTLPTLDELLAMDASFTPETAMDRMLKLACAIAGDHVVTLRAELEGLKFLTACERFIDGLLQQDVQIVALRDLHATLDLATLPRHALTFQEIPGRKGLRMIQGDEFPAGH